MIKIIKEGIKEFTAACPTCGCEFSYGVEDLYMSISCRTVKCPCCRREIIHDEVARISQNDQKKQALDNMTWKTPEYKEFQKALDKQLKQPSYVDCNKPTNPCETCSYYQKLKSGEIYVGDSPCQWCQHSGLKVTCTSTGTSTGEVK